MLTFDNFTNFDEIKLQGLELDGCCDCSLEKSFCRDRPFLSNWPFTLSRKLT